jgi:phage-related protein
MLVEDSVRTYLKENGMEEGFWGGMKNLAQKGTQAVGNGMANVGRGIANKAQNAYNSAKETATNAYNNVASAANNAYNNVKTAYQQGSAQQDIQNVNNALKPMVQKGILGQQQYKTILGMLNRAIQAQGGQRMQGLA